MTHMLAVEIASPGGPDVLRTVELPLPEPGPGEVLIRVAAAGVNAPDLAQRRGDYPPPEGASPLPGLEVSGEIAVAAGAWRIGDKVVALSNGGGYAEYVAVPAGQVLPLPANWSFTDAAALPECWFTIVQTLVMRSGLASGMTVLIHGAAGGIGGAAIQACKIIGAKSIAVVSSAEKAAYALALGADATIRHDLEDFVIRTRELTGSRGADRIIDMQGGGTSCRNIDAAARSGHIILIATLEDRNADLPLNKIVGKQLTLSGSTLRPQSPQAKAAIAARLRADFWPAMGTTDFPRPQVRALPLAEAAEAHRAMENRAHLGKIVLITRFGAGQ